MLRVMLSLLCLTSMLHCNAKESLLILGTVFAQGEVCNGARIYVYEHEEEMRYELTPQTGNFYVSIPKDKKVILSIEKPGFLSKKVEVDTRADDFPHHRMTFFCDVDLLEERVFQGVDKKLFENPLGIVYFNPIERLFVLDKFKAFWTKRDLKKEKKKNKKNRKIAKHKRNSKARKPKNVLSKK